MRLAIILLILLTAVLGVPFVVRESIEWRELSGVLLAGTACFAAALLLHAAATTTAADAVGFLAWCLLVSVAAELCGLHWGWSFMARYRYHEDLAPQPGGLPLFIPLAWYALASVPLVMFRRMRLPRGRRRLGAALAKSALCAAALTGADLLLDPLAVHVDAWQWDPAGRYFGVPLANYLGWLLVGVVIYLPYFLLHSGRVADNARRLDDAVMAPAAGLTLMALAAAAIRLRHWLPLAVFLPVAIPCWLYYLRARLPPQQPE